MDPKNVFSQKSPIFWNFEASSRILTSNRSFCPAPIYRDIYFALKCLPAQCATQDRVPTSLRDKGDGETDPTKIRYRMKIFAKLSKTFKGQSTCKLHCIRKFFKTLSSRNVSWICILKKLKTYWDNDSAFWKGNIHNSDSDKDIFWWLNQTNLFWPILQLNNVLHFDHIEIPRIISFW